MDKYRVAAAKFYHTLYKTNFYNTSNAFQRQWTEAMKDFLNEVGNGRNS